MIIFIGDADQSDTGKSQLEFLYEMPSDDVHRVLKTVADRYIVGLPKQTVFDLRGLHGSNRITNGPPREPYLPLEFASAVPDELCDKVNHLLLDKKNRKTDDLKMNQFFQDCRVADSDPHESNQNCNSGWNQLFDNPDESFLVTTFWNLWSNKILVQISILGLFFGFLL